MQRSCLFALSFATAVALLHPLCAVGQPPPAPASAEPPAQPAGAAQAAPSTPSAFPTQPSPPAAATTASPAIDPTDATAAREGRIAAHRRRIDQIITDNREKHSTAHAARSSTDNGAYLIRIAYGLRMEEARKLCLELEHDLPWTAQIVNSPSLSDVYEVRVAGLPSAEHAEEAYALLQRKGYRFDTLPGYGKVIQFEPATAGTSDHPNDSRERPRRSSKRAPAGHPGPWGGIGVVTPEWLASGDAGSVGLEILDQLSTAGGVVSFAGSHVPLARAADVISRNSGVTIHCYGDTQDESISLLLRNATLKDSVLKILSQLPECVIYMENPKEGIQIWDRASFTSEVLPRFVQRRVFRLKRVQASEAAAAISSAMGSDTVRTAALNRSDSLVVTALPRELEQVTTLIQELEKEDPAPPKPEGGPRVRP